MKMIAVIISVIIIVTSLGAWWILDREEKRKDWRITSLPRFGMNIDIRNWFILIISIGLILAGIFFSMR
jgi:hypothetical protein